jgi:tetratricopeptide (TPR) repeat protein
MRRGLPTAAALALCIAAAAHADRETAQFSSGRGDKAIAAKKFEEAEGFYRKAIEEDETFLPARYGLAQALVGEGRSALAVETLRQFVDDIRSAPASPGEWKALGAKAQMQLADLDATGAALQRIQDAYVEVLVGIAQRWLAKDPAVAERALRRALKIRPDHPKAAEMIGKMGKAAGGQVFDLFDGTSLEQWELVNPSAWQVLDGAILATAQGHTYFIRSARSFEGDFDVRFEARLIDELSSKPYFAVMAAFKSDYDHYSFGRFGGNIWWSDSLTQGKPRDVAVLSPPQLKKPYDAKQWNWYELRFKGTEVRAYLNGDEVAKETRPEGRKDGFVGLVVQDVKVAFRKIQVEVM